MKKPNTAVIIPCYNEAAAIGRVLRLLREVQPEAQLVVVNDCSTDDTAALVGQLAAFDDQITLINLPINLGIGGAVQTGFIFAYRAGYEYAVKFDGDGQHPAAAIDRLLEPLKNNTADFTIGSRFLTHQGFQSTASRRCGIAVFKWLNSALIGQIITDNTSGFRAYNRAAIEFAQAHYPNFDYPEPEEVILMARNKFRIQEVAVEMLERQGGVSSITPFRAFYYMLKVVFSVIMAALRPCERSKK